MPRLFYACWLALVLLLAGCATPVEHRRPVLEANTTDGAMLVRVLPNAATASQFFKNWQSITLARQPQKEGEPEQLYAFSPLSEGTSRTAIYAGALPPGKYRFVSFSAQQCGAMCVSSSITLGPKFSRFEVKSGQLTDLGVLVQTSAPSDTKKVLLAHSTANTPEPATPEIVRELVPGLQKLLQAPLLGWDAATVPTGMGDVFHYAKLVSYGLVSPQELDDGSFIFGSANGVVYRWKPGQREAAYDVGVRSSVETVLVTPTGGWLAGGELGLLQLSDDAGRSWRTVRGNLPLGVVVDLHRWQGQVIATVLRGKQVHVQMAASGSTEWAVLASYELDVSFWWDIPGVRPQSFLLGDRLITTVPGRKLAVLDLATRQSVMRDLPGAVQMFTATDDGVLRCRCSATLAVNPYESRDLGQTWQESAQSRFLSLPAFRDAQHGVGYMGSVFSPGKMAYTADGGKTWTETTELPVPVSRVFYTKDGKLALATTTAGSVWLSKDDGKTWERAPR